MPRTLLLVGLLALCGGRGFASWKALKTDSFLLFYPAGRERQAYDALEALELRRGYVEALVGRSGGRLSVVVVDAGTESNGFTDFLFRRLHLYLYPPSDGEIAFGPSWWDLVGVHEYTHWLQLTSASGLPGALAWALGGAYAPNAWVPDWLAEGLAVYAESGITPYGGRLNEGTFDAYLAARMRALRPPSLPEATFSPPDYPGGGGPYLFGGAFVRYLAEAHGPEALAQFIQRYGASPLSYLSPLLPLAGLDRTARSVFGKRFAMLWQDWLLEEARRTQGLPPGQRPLSAPAWRLSRPVVSEGRLYFFRSSLTPAGPFQTRFRHELRALDLETGRERVLLRSPSPFTAGLKLRDGRLYYAVAELRSGLANVEMLSYGAGSVIYAYELESGRSRRVLEEPLRAFEALPGGGIVFSKDRADAFGSDIFLWTKTPEPGRANPRLLLRSEYLVREILVEDGRILVSARRDDENFRIYRVEPDSFRLQPLVSGPYASGGMSLAGDRLLFISNEGGRYAVYCGDPQATEQTQAAERLAGTEDAAAAVYDPSGGRLYYRGLHPEGWALYGRSWRPEGQQTGAVPALSAVLTPSAAEAEARMEPVELSIRPGGCLDNLATLTPRLLLPALVLDTATGRYQAGASLLGVSALGDIRYSVAGLFDVQTGAPAVQGGVWFLLPLLAFSLLGSTLDAGWLEAALEAPILERRAPLERSLSLGLSALFLGAGLAAKTYEPFVSFRLAGALDEGSGTVGFPFQRLELGSLQNRAALSGQLSYRHAFPFGALEASISGVHDLGGLAWRLPVLRGYAEALTAASGLTLDLDFPLRLVKIRQGFWNPPLYVQDLYFNPFAAAALNERLELQAAGGAEVHWEIKAGAAYTGWPLDLILRAAVNRDGLFSFGFFLAASEMPEGIWPSRSDRRRITP